MNASILSFFEFIKYLPSAVVIVSQNDYRMLCVNQLFERFFGYSNADINENLLFFQNILEPEQSQRFLDFACSCILPNADMSKSVIVRIESKGGTITSNYLYASFVPAGSQSVEGFLLLHIQPNRSKFDLPFWSFESREVLLEQLMRDDIGLLEWYVSKAKVYLSRTINDILETNIVDFEVKPDFILSFIHPEDQKKFFDALAIAGKSGIESEMEIRIITLVGNVKHVLFIIRSFPDSDGVYKVLGCFRDVTAHRQIEHNFRKNLEELNNSNKELEEFAYVASHDLQEPLRKISTFGDRLSSKYHDVLADEGVLYLQKIIASTDNMRILINDLLEFSRITKTKQPFAPTDLNAVFRIAKADLELRVEEANATIECAKLPMLEGIHSQFLQLFTNILSNALKFRKHGINPIIEIMSEVLSNETKSTLGLDKKVSYYKISFFDNGIGFDEIYASRIFQVFQRLHGKSEYPGTGIGLAICKKIAEYHHGLIYAKSQPGVGSRFIIILPESQESFKKLINE